MALGEAIAQPGKPAIPFRYFNSSPEIIRLVVVIYVMFPLSLRNVEDLLAECRIDICHATVWHWWNRFGPMFASEIRRMRVDRMKDFTHWTWLETNELGLSAEFLRPVEMSVTCPIRREA